MISTLFRSASRACIAGAVVAVLASAGLAKADDKAALSSTFALDATSHFISYGADVWGGGDEVSPFSPRSTVFAEGTFTLALADNLSVYLDVWSDNNDNVTSGLGGGIQEIDVNTGIIYTLDKVWSFKLAHGFWNYASAQEKVIDFGVSYSDGNIITHSDAISLNPSVMFHYRYEGNGGQDCGLAVVPGIAPSFSIAPDSPYKPTISVPLSVGIFQDNFQGGDGGYGYASAGVKFSANLAFIPAKYGAWAAAVSLTYYNTPEDSIPNNPEENFVVSDIGISVSF